VCIDNSNVKFSNNINELKSMQHFQSDHFFGNGVPCTLSQEANVAGLEGK